MRLAKGKAVAYSTGRMVGFGVATAPGRESAATDTAACKQSWTRASIEEEGLHRVFVYGTLKTGFPNSHLLRNAHYKGHFRTCTKYPLVVGGEFYSPYLLNWPGEGANVRGEVYEVDDFMLGNLDELERVGVNYTRKSVKVFDKNEDDAIEVYAYLKCNYTRELLEAERHQEYNDRRYVPRHMRPKAPTSARSTKPQLLRVAA